MSCCSQACCAAALAGTQGDHADRFAEAWAATAAAALARNCSAVASSAAVSPPATLLVSAGFPPTLNRSRTVLSYWVGDSSRACAAAGCAVAPLQAAETDPNPAPAPNPPPELPGAPAAPEPTPTPAPNPPGVAPPPPRPDEP